MTDQVSFPVMAEPADGDIALGISNGVRVTPNTFEFHGLLPGAYLLKFIALGNNSVKSVMVDGQEHHYVPIDVSSGGDVDVVVTLTDKKITLSGTVADARATPVPGAVVFAFPVEREQWTNYGFTSTRLRQSPASSSTAPTNSESSGG